tara:strand:+ start:772 stop:1131 length:360 start_codon:yes stop_codon:yes gene_type:complete
MKNPTAQRATDWILDGERRVFVYANTPHEWAIGLRAKLDTGADSSSIDDMLAQALGLDMVGSVTVRNSHGKEKRSCYSAMIKFDGEVYQINLTGSDRSELEFPMIIGRDLLQEICLEEE